MQKNINFDLLSAKDIAQFIDHTLLKPDIYKNEIKTLCDEALFHNFYSVCVNASMLGFAREHLRGTDVKMVAVIGFPLGATDPSSKAFEATRCINMGAHEIDMVLNIGALKAGDHSYIKREIEDVVRASEGHIVKVIIETYLLSDDQKRTACELSMDGGAHFVKTCTGFNGGGATLEDIKLMKDVVSPKLQVKASGGIRDYKFARELLMAGATRLGTSSGVKIVQGLDGQGNY